jgi:hypothetical protein
MVASLARTVFGLLDLLLFFRHVLPSAEHALRYFRDPAPWPAFVLGIEAVRTLAVVSLLASGAFLLRRRRGSAIAITLLQLPLRIAFGLFTFDFLLALDRFLPPTLEAQYGLLLALILLEVARAVLTPFILRTRSRAQPDPLAPRGEAVS